jgi:hypothetical protein
VLSSSLRNNTNSISDSNFYAMARNTVGTANLFSTAQFGSWFFGNGLNESGVTNFTLALKNLWETATGLTLEGAEYISTITAAGATVTATQEAAIHDFIRTGKSDGWWSSLKRLYLPIWASAAPNAVDMITRVSGTYNGTVTHSAGYVQGDGSTGYFAVDETPANLGMTNASGSLFALRKSVVGAKFIIGTVASEAQRTYLTAVGGALQGQYINASGSYTGPTSSDDDGIALMNRLDGDTTVHFRTSTGETTNVNTYADTGTIATSVMHVMALNGRTTQRDSSHYGAYGCGLGMTTANTTAFTLALKNLWETSTSLTLP